MDKKTFAWIIPSTWLPLMDSQKGIAPCYSIPISQIHLSNDIVESGLFIIARGKSDFLFAYIFVDLVEIEVDENNEPQEYLIKVNVEKSLRIARVEHSQDVEEFSTPIFVAKEFGLIELDEKEVGTLIEIIKKHIKTQFFNVDSKDIVRLHLPREQRDSPLAPILVLREVVRNYALSELWGSPSCRNPVINFVDAYLKNNSVTTDVRSLSAVGFLSAVLSTGNSASLKMDEVQMGCSVLLNTDINLNPINPQRIKNRRFKVVGNTLSVGEILAKTEIAEARHQNMLRDIAQYLHSISVTPLQSNSIDLAIEEANGLTIFEIKSITNKNILSQVAKGMFQLLHYSVVLEECNFSVKRCCLVLEATTSLQNFEIINKLATKSGITLLIYDGLKDWPKRLSFFDLDTLNLSPFFEC